MRWTIVFGLGCSAAFACGGRSSLGLESGVSERDGAGRGTFGVPMQVGTGGAGGRQSGAVTAAGRRGVAGGDTTAVAGGRAGQAGGGGLGGAAQGGSNGAVRSLPGSPWDVMSYDGALQNSPARYDSVWADGPDRVWFTASDGYYPSATRLLHWEAGVISTEVSECESVGSNVHGVAADDLWLAGCGGALLHRAASTWSTSARQATRRVWENSATDVWSCCEAGSENGAASAMHFDGSSWSAVQMPMRYTGGAIWSSGPQDLWIADTDVLHWNGATWTMLHSPACNNWSDVWGDGTNVWAVGPLGTLARWNGSDFETIPTASVYPEGAQLSGIWSRTPADVWFVGRAGAILHWDGKRLARESVALVDPNASFAAVWGAGDALWVVGGETTLMRRKLEPLP